jgi:hypothetical protein
MDRRLPAPTARGDGIAQPSGIVRDGGASWAVNTRWGVKFRKFLSCRSQAECPVNPYLAGVPLVFPGCDVLHPPFEKSTPQSKIDDPLNALARSWDGERHGDPWRNPARTEPRPPGIMQSRLVRRRSPGHNPRGPAIQASPGRSRIANGRWRIAVGLRRGATSRLPACNISSIGGT